MEKVRAELALFSVEKTRALHLTSFLLSVLLLKIATNQSARGNFDNYCEMVLGVDHSHVLQKLVTSPYNGHHCGWSVNMGSTDFPYVECIPIDLDQ